MILGYLSRSKNIIGTSYNFQTKIQKTKLPNTRSLRSIILIIRGTLLFSLRIFIIENQIIADSEVVIHNVK